jgi:hypothetical protein
MMGEVHLANSQEHGKRNQPEIFKTTSICRVSSVVKCTLNPDEITCNFCKVKLVNQ